MEAYALTVARKQIKHWFRHRGVILLNDFKFSTDVFECSLVDFESLRIGLRFTPSGIRTVDDDYENFHGHAETHETADDEKGVMVFELPLLPGSDETFGYFYTVLKESEFRAKYPAAVSLLKN